MKRFLPASTLVLPLVLVLVPSAAGAQQPQLTPFDDPPDLVNAEEVEALYRERQEALAAELRSPQAGEWIFLSPEAPVRTERVRRVVWLWLFVAEDGAVSRVQVKETSRNERVDDAALEIAAVMRFDAARSRGEAVGVWITVPVVFQ